MTRLAIVCLFLAACGSDPVNFSSPVGINIKAKSGDVSGTAISDDKGITTETGNPYSAFVTDAVTKLGKQPGAIEVDHLTITLGANSTNVVTLEEVFAGDVDTSFIMNDTNNTYDVGHITNPTGIGPDGVDVTFASSQVAGLDFDKLLNGSFKVVVRGNAATSFMSKGAEADLQMTFTFAAFE
jgi:hypothetical protein